MDIVEKRIKMSGVDALSLLGINDSNLQIISDRFDANIIVRGDSILIKGEEGETNRVEKVFKELMYVLNRTGVLKTDDVITVIELVSGESEKQESGDSKDIVVLSAKNDLIKPKTPGQRQLVRAVQKNDVVFAVGPAGTGKTYLAVAMAVAALRNREVQKIVLTRPAVEAGESLGFLPGDLKEKVIPYLRPLYDALDDMLPQDKLKLYVEKNIIEIAPLAYMRGRTLGNSFVILDEAQNASSMQMKMFLTRLGVNSKAIVTGDITQIDLPQKSLSGLVEIQKVLKNVQGVSFVYLEKIDVVRHKLVKDIIDAYEKYNNWDGKD
ncbi:MAG: PhoH family protein [Bacteroidetes bacterium]|nr:PhoH family protein [Bacteroidota bacterium]MCL5737232.1 PhoH family protein [Bacteroidota bacterium]